jgi:anti-anti-sigma factor
MPGPEPARTCPGPEQLTRSDPEATPAGLVCLRDGTDDGTIRFALAGELDIATAPELDRALRTAQQTAALITVDLRRLSFMDCRGLAVIVAAAERADAGSGDFRVVRGPPQVHRLFTLTEADRRVAITPAR